MKSIEFQILDVAFLILLIVYFSVSKVLGFFSNIVQRLYCRTCILVVLLTWAQTLPHTLPIKGIVACGDPYAFTCILQVTLITIRA